MRTTVTLDPDVEKLVRDAMARGRKSFQRAVNDAIEIEEYRRKTRALEEAAR